MRQWSGINKRIAKQPRCAVRQRQSTKQINQLTSQKEVKWKLIWVALIDCAENCSSSLLLFSSFFIHWMRQLGPAFNWIKKDKFFFFFIVGYERPTAPLPQKTNQFHKLHLFHCFSSLAIQHQLKRRRVNQSIIKESKDGWWSWNEVGQPSSSPITHCPLIERMKFFHWRAGCSFHFIPLHSTKEKKNKFIFSLLSFRFTCGMNERN